MSVDKKISFLIFGRPGSSPKQFTLHKTIIYSAFAIALLGVGISGYFLLNYNQMRENLAVRQVLEKEVVRQKDELDTQRLQIQRFAKEIGSLKFKIGELIQLENRVHTLAELGDNATPADAFGLGGPIPQDQKLSLSDSHDELLRRMSDDITHLEKASETRQERLKALLKSLEEKLEVLAHTPSVLPVSGRVTSRYGTRKSPFTGRKELHSGLDIGAPRGTPIRATANGVVKWSGRKGPLGLLVIINHGNGLETYYAHCSKLLKKKGARVERGDKIALVGNTGRSTGAHVHYEVRQNGTPLNPREFVLKR